MVIYEIGEFELVGEFARDVKEGLGSAKKNLKPKYFYDQIGSQLFEQISLQPEYYLTRTEADILRRYSSDIVKMYDGDFTLIELGSGSATKTRILLSYILNKQRQLYYLPIDLSQPILQETIRKLSTDFSNLHAEGIRSEYGEGIRKASEFIATKDRVPEKKMIIFLGSSIGNFELPECSSFLRMIRDRVEKKDALLVGFDLQKDKKILNAAYNDKAGLTAKFNLNLLARINRVLMGEFDLKAFYHHAFYNESKQRIEMHLVSKSNQQVYIGGIDQTFRFEERETIHTENSYKFTLDQIQTLAEDSGFELKNFMDEKGWFDLALLSPI